MFSSRSPKTDPVELVENALAARNIAATTRLTTATLEDVFVAVTMKPRSNGMKSLSRIMAIVKKEIRQLRRDRLTFGMIVGLPVIQMLLFGYAINTDVRNLRTAVSNQAGTHLSQQFVAELRQTQVVDIIEFVETVDELETLLRRGEISIGVVIPPILIAASAIGPVPPCSCWSMAAIRPYSASRISCERCRFASIRPQYTGTVADCSRFVPTTTPSAARP